jgi:hypothetical protein
MLPAEWRKRDTYSGYVISSNRSTSCRSRQTFPITRSLETVARATHRIVRMAFVPYWSSHLDGAKSELIVHSGHGAQYDPEAIREVERILKENLTDKN